MPGIALQEITQALDLYDEYIDAKVSHVPSRR
jgi:hypothetical protein